jgi:hypothetical protein
MPVKRELSPNVYGLLLSVERRRLSDKRLAEIAKCISECVSDHPRATFLRVTQERPLFQKEPYGFYVVAHFRISDVKTKREQKVFEKAEAAALQQLIQACF